MNTLLWYCEEYLVILGQPNGYGRRFIMVDDQKRPLLVTMNWVGSIQILPRI